MFSCSVILLDRSFDYANKADCVGSMVREKENIILVNYIMNKRHLLKLKLKHLSDGNSQSDFGSQLKELQTECKG